ncbi:MAG: hypothetical protein OXC91_08700 [Rhodobacteraceae bacterium]|nr:hypothetical protein [Paracoccaceae bacterium]
MQIGDTTRRVPVRHSHLWADEFGIPIRWRLAVEGGDGWLWWPRRLPPDPRVFGGPCMVAAVRIVSDDISPAASGVLTAVIVRMVLSGSVFEGVPDRVPL